MPFAWNQTEPPRIGQVDKWDVPLNEWMGIKFAGGQGFQLGRAVSEFTEDQIYDNGDVMSPELANKVWGIPGALKFDAPVSIQRAALMRQRKEVELEQLAYTESASHSGFSGKAALGFVSGLAGGFAHPLDAATIFLPFVGSASKAGGMAKMGAGGFRQAIARGVVTQETLGAGRLTTAMVDGVLSQAAIEIPVALQKARNQADYGLEDSAINILGGGIFAGGIHLTVRGVSALFRRASEMHSRLDPTTRDALVLEQERAFVTGDKPDTARIINIDEDAIRARILNEEFNQIAAEREAVLETAKSEAEIVAEVRSEIGQPAATGIEAVNRADFVRVKVPEGGTFIRATDAEGRTAVVPVASFKRGNVLKGADIVQIEAGNIVRGGEFAPIAGEVKVIQTAGKGRRPLPDVREIERRVQAERDRRIDDFITTRKDKWTHDVEQRIDAERVAEIARQQAEGRILSPEEIKRYTTSPVPKEAEINAVKEDAATLEKEILATALTPEEKVSLQKELDELQEGVYFDKSKPIDAAVPCVTRNG